MPSSPTRSDTGPVVAHVIFRFGIGGMENGLVNLVNHTGDGGARHEIVCLTEADASFRRRIEVDGVGVHELHKRPGKDPAIYARLWRLLRQLRPDVLHTRNIGTIDAQVPGVAAGIGLRLHGWHGWHAEDPDGTSRKYALLTRTINPLIHRHVCVSRDLATWLSARVGVAASRVEQICNGVDADRFAPPPGGRAPLPAAVTAGAGDLVVGTVGRLDPIKEQARLIEAIAILRQRSPGGRRLRLVIVGDGPLREALAGEVRARGVEDLVWFAGARDDVPALLRAFDVFALPSRNEGISNTVLEAMATGLPVVATDVGGNPELVVDGETGRLVPVADTAALTCALAAYAEDDTLRRRHGRGARARVLAQFSIPAMAARYLALYTSARRRRRN